MGYFVSEEIGKVNKKRILIRNHYQEIFDNNLKQMEYVMGKNHICVLNYFGIGGIGKTSICSLIEKKLQSHNKTIKYCSYDFSYGEDVEAILVALKNSLRNKYKFKFPVFELALMALEQKKDNTRINLYKKSIIQQSDLFSQFEDLAEAVPILSDATSMVKVLDSLVSMLQGVYKNFNLKEHLYEMELLSAAELIDRLPIYFSVDMRVNLKKEKKPIVFFFDTYEKCEKINSLYEINDDSWLKGEDGLIRNIPNALWVVSGRNRLMWDLEDSNWSDEIFHPCEVEAFSYDDSLYYLRENGINDEATIRGIASITKGYPMYLDLYVELYKNQANRDSNYLMSVDVNAIVERIFESYNLTQRELLWYLVCLKKWNEEDIDVLINNFGLEVITNYDQIKRTSLVHTNESYCCVPEGIWSILIQQCPSKIILHFCNIWIDNGFSFDEATESILLKANVIKEKNVELYNRVVLHLDDTLGGYANNYYFRRIDKILDMCKRYNEKVSCPKIKSIILTYTILEMLNIGNYKEAYSVAISLNEKYEEYTESFLIAKSLAFMKMGKYKEGQAIDDIIIKNTLNADVAVRTRIQRLKTLNLQGRYEEVLDEGRSILQINTLSTKNKMDVNSELGASMYKLGMAKEALEYYKIVKTMIEEMNLPNPFIMMNAKSNEATALEGLKRYDEAYYIYDEVYREYCQRLGESHPNTLKCLCNIGTIYSKKGNHEEAYKIYCYIYSCYGEFYGADNPETYKILRLVSYEQYYLGMINEAIQNLSYVYDYMEAYYGVDNCEVNKVRELISAIKMEL